MAVPRESVNSISQHSLSYFGQELAQFIRLGKEERSSDVMIESCLIIVTQQTSTENDRNVLCPKNSTHRLYTLTIYGHCGNH